MCCLGESKNPCWWMARYMVNPRGGFLSVWHSNPGIGICGKSWRVGLILWPSDLGLVCCKDWETRRQENSSQCGWIIPMASMLAWTSHRVEIMVKPIMICLLCWPNDRGWITIKFSFCWWGWCSIASVFPGWFFWFESHIHAWNMTWVWMDEERSGSTILW